MTSDEGDEFFTLDPVLTDPKRLKKEREKAQKLKKTQWWRDQLNLGLCHYCGNKFPAGKLTMDHVVPIARGGESNKGNIVPSCSDCNRKKKLMTPAELLLQELERQKSGKGSG